MIRFAPPLSITKSEIDEGMEIFEEALRASEQGLDAHQVTEEAFVAA